MTETRSRQRMIYLSGPMKGYENSNYPTFHRVTGILRDAGHAVYNPAEFKWSGTDHAQFPLREAFAEHSRHICLVACTIVLLPGWEKSLGVSAELALARNCKLDAFEYIETSKGGFLKPLTA